MNLVLRLFDPQQGTITIDGSPVDRLTREQLAKTASLVPQRPYLFSGTIGTNLRFGKQNASDEELWEALRVAQGDDFVREEGGLDEPVSQRAVRASRVGNGSGCRSREHSSPNLGSTSSTTRSRRSTSRPTLGCVPPCPRPPRATTIIVAQRVSTITEADQILVMEDGEIAGRGTHEELLESNPVYQEIVQSQMEAVDASGEVA